MVNSKYYINKTVPFEVSDVTYGDTYSEFVLIM